MKPLILPYRPAGAPLLTAPVKDVLRSACREATATGRRQPWTPGEATVVSFIGGRGTGKSTTLASACELLERDGHIVLPLVEPDLFVASETLATVIIQSIRNNLLPGEQEEPRGSHGATDGGLAERCRALLRRASVARSTSFRPTGPLDQFVMDDSRANEVASMFSNEWAEVVGMVTPPEAALVIPVDDLDLSFERLSELLDDLRILATAPGTVFLIAADLEECRRLLLARHHRILGEIELPSRRVGGEERGLHLYPSWQPSVDGQLAKILPRDRRIALEPLGPAERLGFAPRGANTSILGLLSRVPLGEFPGTPTVASLFMAEAGAGGLPTLYAEVIPDNRRMLTALHRALERALDSESSGEEVRRSVALTLLAYGLETGLSQTAVRELQPDDFISLEYDETGSERLRVNFQLLNFFGTVRQTSTTEPRYTARVAREKAVEPPSKSTIESAPGPPERLPDEVPSGDDSAAGGPGEERPLEVEILVPGRTIGRLKGASGEDEREVGSALTHVLLLERELALNYSVPARHRVIGVPPRRGGRSQFVRVSRSDNDFIRLPAWDGYFDGWLFDVGWKQVHDNIIQADASQGEALPPQRIATAAILDAWRIVASVQADRYLYAGPLATEECGQRGWDEDLEVTWRRLKQSYETATSGRSTRANDYVRWFEGVLAFGIHPWVMEADLREYCWAERKATVTAAGRDRVAEDILAGHLASRVRDHLGLPWVEPILEDLERLRPTDPDLVPELRAGHERRARLREEERVARLGEALSRAAAPSAQSLRRGQTAEEEARLVRNADDLFATTMRILRRMRDEVADDTMSQ